MAHLDKPRLHSNFLGDDVEQAYAELFGAKRVGGVEDNGKDIQTGIEDIPHVQIKSSWDYARKFLTESMRRREFIPLCVGEPGSRDEVVESIREFGAWLAKDIPNRNDLLENIRQVRTLIQRTRSEVTRN